MCRLYILFHLCVFFLMFPYFPSNPLKGLIITKFFCYWKIFPAFSPFYHFIQVLEFKTWATTWKKFKVKSVEKWLSHPKTYRYWEQLICCLIFFTICDLQKPFSCATSFCSINIIKTFPFACWLCTWKILWRAVSYSEFVLNTNKYS